MRFSGRLRFRECFATWQNVRGLAEAVAPPARLDIDLSGVEHLDGAATALLLELRADLEAKGVAPEIVGAHGAVSAMLELYGAHAPRPSLQPPPAPIGILDQIGRETLAMLGESKGLDFVGDVVVAGAQALRRPSLVNWGDVPKLMERAGADGLPIVLMINFLVGLVTGFQAALQLKQFGANVFEADLVGLSITRELAPLMTAIIVAGRSGAAFSAELGTMRVSEEIDALRTLGFDPYHFLVFPARRRAGPGPAAAHDPRRPRRHRRRAAGRDDEPRSHRPRVPARGAEGGQRVGRLVGVREDRRLRPQHRL